MTMIDRRTILKGAAAGAALVASPAVPRAQAPAVKIGILQPVTGALAQDGEHGRLGAEIALAEINAAGGIKSMGGARLEMVFGDARSNPEASPICLAASQAAARYDIPYLVDVGVSDQIVKRGLKNTFRFGPGFGAVTSAALDNLVKINDEAGKPARTVVIVHEDGLFGSGMAKLLQAELPKRGFEILETVAHPTPSRDMANVALRIRALNPDLVIPSSYYGEFVLLARTMQQQRIRPKAIYAVLNGAASNFRFVTEFPAAAELVMDCNHWPDHRNPKTAQVRAEAQRAGKFWLYNTPLNYSSVMLLADAIERAGSAHRIKIIEALKSSTFAGHIMPYGPTKFVEGQNQGAQAVNTQVQGGDIKIVFPAAFANAKPIFPAR